MLGRGLEDGHHRKKLIEKLVCEMISYAMPLAARDPLDKAARNAGWPWFGLVFSCISAQ